MLFNNGDFHPSSIETGTLLTILLALPVASSFTHLITVAILFSIVGDSALAAPMQHGIGARRMEDRALPNFGVGQIFGGWNHRDPTDPETSVRTVRPAPTIPASLPFLDPGPLHFGG